MIEILRTTDIVTLSFALSLLQDAGLEPLVADVHMAAMEGSIGIFPRRVHVLREDEQLARKILREAGLDAWLV